MGPRRWSAPQSLIRSKNVEFPWAFTSDGSRLGYLELGKGGYDLWTLPLEGDSVSGIRPGKPEVFLNSDFDERVAVIFSRWEVAGVFLQRKRGL